MREAVEERAGEPLGAEHGRPLVERQIARDQHAASLVAHNTLSAQDNSPPCSVHDPAILDLISYGSGMNSLPDCSILLCCRCSIDRRICLRAAP